MPRARPAKLAAMTTSNQTSAPYVFHAYDVSYFSAKVRPALRYNESRPHQALQEKTPSQFAMQAKELERSISFQTAEN
jgi:hypothetical protein